MSKKFTISLFAVVCGVVLLNGAATLAGDDAPPSLETVCDELQGGTPGLYGLCVAFNEAQDCEPDYTLEDPLENCKPASRKILEAYNRKRNASDPPMPGIEDPCPCFLQAWVDALPLPPGQPCYAQCAFQATQLPDNPTPFSNIIASFTPTVVAQVVEPGADTKSSCLFVSADDPQVIRFFQDITPDEVAACTAIIQNSQELNIDLCQPSLTVPDGTCY
jgi:hypothetical protein